MQTPTFPPSKHTLPQEGQRPHPRAISVSTRCCSLAVSPCRAVNEFISHEFLSLHLKFIEISATASHGNELHFLTRWWVPDMQRLIWCASAHGHIVTFQQVVFKFTPPSSHCCYRKQSCNACQVAVTAGPLQTLP